MKLARYTFAVLVLGCASVVHAAEDRPPLMLDTGGHMAGVKGLSFTPDGKQLVSAGDDKVIRVWDWRSGKTVRTIRGQVGPGDDGKIYAMALSPDGRWLAVGGLLPPSPDYGAIRLYDFATGEMKQLLLAHVGGIGALAFSPDSGRLVSGGGDGLAIIWDVATGRVLHRLSGHADTINGVAFNAAGSHVATASDDGALKLWRTDGRLVSTLKGHRKTVMGVSFSPADGSIVSTSWDRTMKFWNGETGRLLRSIDVQCPWGVSYAPDGRFVVCSSGNVIDASARKEILKHQPSTGHTVAVSQDSRWAATIDRDDAVRVWDIARGHDEVVLGGIGQDIWALGFSNDGCDLAWGNTWVREKVNDRADLALEIGLPCAGKTISAPRPLSQPVTAYTKPVTKHGANELVLASSIRGPEAVANMNLLHVKQGSKTIATLDASRYGFRHQVYTFTPDGKTVLSGGANGEFDAYDIANQQVQPYIGHVGYVYAVAVTSDGRLAASGATDKTINLWNVVTHELIVTLFYDRNGEWVMWTPQGYYASSPNGDRIVGWQINKGTDQAAEYVTASQLKSHFYRPDIVERAIILASANAAVAQARGTDFSLTELLKRRPPAFEIVSPLERSRAGVSPTELRLNLEPNDDPVETIEVLVNGRQATTPELRNATARFAASGTLERRITVPLEQGENKIRIVAHNKVGQAVRDFVLFYDRPGLLDRRGTLHVLAVGVDKYPRLLPICGPQHNQTCDLEFAGKDARAFHDVLVEQARPFYRDIKTRLLAQGGDKPPTKANIEDALGEIFGKARPEDTTVLFIAGHGVLDRQGTEYLFLPEDAEPSGDGWGGSTVLPWTTFQNALGSTQGRRLMFADTCHAGGAYNSRLVKDAADADIIVFSATDPKTVSWEFPHLSHGAFTYALIRGLEGEARRSDGSVTLLGLSAFVSGEVGSLTNDKQQPTFHFSGAKDSILAGTREAAERERSAREAAEQQATAREVLAPVQDAAQDESVVDMLFATSRKAVVSPLNVTFTRERAEDLSFGSLRVRVPEAHKIGRLELPTTRNFILVKYEEAPDQKKHFVMRDITLLDREGFIQKVKTADRSEALVFVHGFNSTFEEAAFRLAQIAFDINYKGLPILFSWASASGVGAYRHDIESASHAREMFVDFLRTLQEKAEIRTVHIIAHSMGNALAMEALDRIALQQLPIKVAEFIMAAPDVSRDLFKQLVARINKVAEGMTLYASSKDKALVASKAFALDIARAGDVPAGGPLVLPMMDTIDVSIFGEEFLGLNHNTFAEKRSLLDDIGRLLASRQRPPGLRTPQLKGRPVATNPPKYWLYPD
jgi:esterase/lipase superfamily enzyme/WD40 repeat protein